VTGSWWRPHWLKSNSRSQKDEDLPVRKDPRRALAGVDRGRGLRKKADVSRACGKKG
jgi:hypothetical protein